MQMKEQDKVTASDLSETDVSNRPNGEFKATIVRTFTSFEKRMEDIRETPTAEIRVLKKESMREVECNK